MVYDAYNLSTINGSGVVPLMQTVNEQLMFGWYGNFILIAMFTIFTMAFIASTNNWKKSVAFSSLFTAVASVFLRNMSLVSDSAVLLTWLIAGVVAFLSFITPD